MLLCYITSFHVVLRVNLSAHKLEVVLRVNLSAHKLEVRLLISPHIWGGQGDVTV
jgi:hypothetical protein